MEMEGIPVLSMDVGEDYTRKIIFDVNSGKVFLRNFRNEEVNDIVIQRDEDALIHDITKKFR